MNQRIEVVAAAYAPRAVDPYQWVVVRPFVVDAVVRSRPASEDQARRRLTVVAQLACWARFVAGRPLTVEAVFDPAVVDAWLEQSGLTGKVRAIVRVRLRAVARELGSQAWPGEVVDLAAHTGWRLRPYTEAEVLAADSWAGGQRTALRRSSAQMLLALGLGAGLYTHEVTRVRRRHVHIDDEGVHVEAHGPRPRLVTVLGRYELRLAEAVAGLSEADYVFCPGRTERGRAVVTGFVGRTNRDAGFTPTLPRMRATWIAGLVDGGVPLVYVMAAAGLSSVRVLEDLLARRVEVTEPGVRALMRG